MDKHLRVCWYCEKWQPGGIQAVQVNLLRHMDLSRVDADIVVSEDETTLFDEQLAQLGVNKIVTLDESYSSPAKRVFANVFAFGNHLKKNKYDVVHLNVCHGVELIYAFWAWFYKVPVRIVHCRNNDIGAGGRSRGIKILCHNICKRLFKHCATVKIANSDLAADWLFTKGDVKHNRVHILQNGIDVRRYAFDAAVRERVREELRVQDRVVFGHVGHFNYQKNHEFLIGIFSEIVKRVPNATLLLLGVGDQQPHIEELAKEYGVYDRIIFYGVTNDVPSMMMAMDVFVFPSRFEGFGNVLIEAQATGLPVVASADVIPDCVNITPQMHRVSLNDSFAVWADEAVRLIHDGDRVDGTEAVAKAGHDIAGMAQYLEKLYWGA